MSFRLFEEFLNKLKRFGLEYFGRYYSIYRAQVTDNKDPEYKGRIKVKIVEFGDKDYPYFVSPKFPLIYKDKGVYVVPDVGDYVWVSFQNGDPRFPIYEGNNNIGVFEAPDEFKTNYPLRRGIKTKAGHTIFIDDTEGKETILVRHKDNSYFMFDKDGGIIFGTEGGNYVYIDKDKNIQIRGSDSSGIYINNGQISLINKDGNVVNLGGSGIDLITSKQISVFGNSILLGVGANDPTKINGGGVYVGDMSMTEKLTELNTALSIISSTLMGISAAITTAQSITVDPGAKAVFSAIQTAITTAFTIQIGEIQKVISYLMTDAPSKSVLAKK